MPDSDFVLPSGAKFHITLCSFQEAKALAKSLLKSATGIQLSNNVMDMDVSVLKDALISAATSDEVEKALATCLLRCTYENVKVSDDLFNDTKWGEQARRDYFTMCAKVIEVNCSPFFDQTLSMLKMYLSKKTGSPASA